MYVLLGAWVLAAIVSVSITFSQCGSHNTGSDQDKVSACGNQIVEPEGVPPEVCEQSDVIACAALDSSRYLAGVAVCQNDCLGWNTDACVQRNVCGNGVREGDEVCEEDDHIACTILDAAQFLKGTAACDATRCEWDTRTCIRRMVCGNGAVELENDEECDFAAGLITDCTNIDPDAYVGGTASCGSLCKWLRSNCIPAHMCGNSVVEDEEVCDGFVACTALDPDRYLAGTAFCASDCSAWDLSACIEQDICGNHVIEDGEICEQGDSKYCVSLDNARYQGGLATCTADCTGWDTSACKRRKNEKCGNGIIDDPSEECEAGQSFRCVEIDPDIFVGGNAPCNDTCSGWDVTPCLRRNSCGNGLFELGEECEKEDTIPCEEILPGHFYPGSASCLPDCSGWDVAKCTEKDVCGNGIIETGEVCERGEKSPCATLDPEKWGYGIAICYYDCSGWNLDDCLPPTPAEEMVALAGGEFTMGCDPTTTNDCLTHEKPAHTVRIDPFQIDRTEVTVGAFAICVAAGACKGNTFSTFAGMISCNYGSDRDPMLPMNCVSWEGARDYCAWRGKRLPTEAEWEFAARSADRRTYPWGSQPPDCTRALYDACGATLLQAVGALSAGASPFGLVDMAGNVREWVADWYAYDYYWSSVKDNPQGPATGTQKVMRGGSYQSDARSLRTYARYANSPTMTYPDFGFRCAK